MSCLKLQRLRQHETMVSYASLICLSPYNHVIHGSGMSHSDRQEQETQSRTKGEDQEGTHIPGKASKWGHMDVWQP